MGKSGVQWLSKDRPIPWRLAIGCSRFLLSFVICWSLVFVLAVYSGLTLDSPTFSRLSESKSNQRYDDGLESWQPRTVYLTPNESNFIIRTGRRIRETRGTRERRKHPPASWDKSIRPALQIDSVPISETVPYGAPQHKASNRTQCVPMKPWQVTSYPTCNSMHEVDMKSVGVGLLGKGTIRSAWDVRSKQYGEHSGNIHVVLKTLQLSRKDCKFEPQRYESHRRDAMATERLTSSPRVVDIYGFCAQSSVNEMLSSNLETFHEEPKPSLEKLRVAREAALALADVHDVDGEGYVTIVHRDVTHRNFLVGINGTLKINDFNVGRFPEWDVEANATCGFRKNDCTGYRSPEECRHNVLSEKIDIYMLGNTFYYILTGRQPFHYPKKAARRARDFILRGLTPIVPMSYQKSTDPVVKEMLRVIRKCWEQNPKDRPSARAVADELSSLYESFL